MNLTELSSCLNTSPGFLVTQEEEYSYVRSLYRDYGEELEVFCKKMVLHRQSLIEEGYSCDFSDRESELLYLLIRDLKPEVVVEISPCHGYSTNYILAALTANQKGELHSYEIVEFVKGKPIKDVIFDNQHESVDIARLNLHVGDATKKTIPDPDFLFIDSAHEAWFSGWYFLSLVTRAKICMVHDILIDLPSRRTLVPKGPFMGVRESLSVLEMLSQSNQKLLSVAALGSVLNKDKIFNTDKRYPGGPERSVVFVGHELSSSAKEIALGLVKLKELEINIILGDRSSVLELDSMMGEEVPLFLKCISLRMMVGAGYRKAALINEFTRMKGFIHKMNNTQIRTISQAIASAEAGALLGEPRMVRGPLKSTAGMKVNKSLMGFYQGHYRPYGMSINFILSAMLNFLVKLKYKLLNLL